MKLDMLITAVKPMTVDGKQVFEEIDMHSTGKPSANLRLRLGQPEHFGKFTLHQTVSINVHEAEAV
jgi:hypothetical protein